MLTIDIHKAPVTQAQIDAEKKRLEQQMKRLKNKAAISAFITLAILFCTATLLLSEVLHIRVYKVVFTVIGIMYSVVIPRIIYDQMTRSALYNQATKNINEMIKAIDDLKPYENIDKLTSLSQASQDFKKYLSALGEMNRKITDLEFNLFREFVKNKVKEVDLKLNRKKENELYGNEF